MLALAGVALAGAIVYVYSRPPQRVAAAESGEPIVIAASDAAAGVCVAQVPADGGLLVEGLLGAPRYPNPLLSDPNPVDRQLVDLLYDGLVAAQPDGTFAPALAADWDISADGRTLTFALRQDVTWHDGTPFTSRDVMYTVSALQRGNLPGGEPLAQLWRSVTVTAPDAATVVFELAEPYVGILEAATRGILPAHLLEGVTGFALAEHPFNAAPIGTGPFQIVNRWRDRGFVRLAANPAYWDDVRLAQIEWRFYPDIASLVDAFSRGEIHTVIEVGVTAPVAVSQIAALPGANLYTVPAARYGQLIFNQSEGGSPAVREKAVRQALGYALDRPAIIDTALNGQGVPLDGPYLPRSWAYLSGVTAYPHRVLSATQTLADAGWVAPAGQSLRERDDQFLRLNLVTLDDPILLSAAAAVQAQWEAIGVGVEVTPFEATTWRTALVSRAFDVALVEVTPAHDPDLYAFWSQEAIVGGQNYGAWNSQRASEALEAARKIWDQAERQPYYAAFLRYYDSNVPALTLFQRVDSYVVSDRVRSAAIEPFSRPRERYSSLPAWTVLFREVQVACDS